MNESSSEQHKQKMDWSPCPNCGADLRMKVSGFRPLLSECPYCQAQILEIWWQRLLWVLLGLFLSWAVPEALGLRGWTVFFLVPILLFPSFVLAMHLLL